MILSVFSVGEYLDLIERNIPELARIDRESRLTSAKLFATSKTQSSFQLNMANGIADHMEQNVISRYIRASFIVILWSVFENALNRIAKDVYDNNPDKELGVWRLTMRDLNGDVITRFNNFISSVIMGFLWVDDKQIEKLKGIYKIRNVIAHNNLNVPDSSCKELKTLLDWEVGIQIVNEELQVEEGFCRWSYEAIRQAIMCLVVNQ